MAKYVQVLRELPETGGELSHTIRQLVNGIDKYGWQIRESTDALRQLF